MHVTLRTASFSAALVLAAALAACSDGQLAPPDGVSCTVGSLTPGDSVTRTLGASACSVWSDYNFTQTVAQSWTIQAEAGRAYVVSLYHLQDTAGSDHIRADLWLYARNAGGDAELATGYWTSFGANNTNNGKNEDLIFTSTRPQTVSIRVEAVVPSDTGAYAIQVVSCPAPMVADTTTSDPVAVESSCATHNGLGDGLPTRMAFWTFRSDTAHAPEVTFTRTAGTAAFRAYVTGEGSDFGCWGEECTSASSGASAGPSTLFPTIYLNGGFSGSAVIHADSAATITMGLFNDPITAPRPPFTGPARADRDR